MAGFALEVLALHANADRHLILREDYFAGREDVGDDDVFGAADSNAEGVDGDTFLPCRFGGHDRVGTGVVTSIGQQQNAGQGLAARAGDGFTQLIADRRDRAPGGELVHPCQRGR